jgi:hypothetical protein
MSSWLGSSSRRALNRSRNDNGSFEYEMRPTETTRDLGFDMSQDGLRGVRSALNVSLKKQKIRPSDLVDAYGDWMPLAEDGEGAVQEDPDVDGPEFQAQTGEKRHRYESSVSNQRELD